METQKTRHRPEMIVYARLDQQMRELNGKGSRDILEHVRVNADAEEMAQVPEMIGDAEFHFTHLKSKCGHAGKNGREKVEGTWQG